ncbi:MAG: HAD-IC family P-type ATPase [Actinomycetota bacterium]|nr:HAD-IC family P-type ATPase [Actinomycetota bacterium]
MSAADVAARVAQGQTNDSGERSSRTFGEILRANLLTRFNAILGVLLIAILAVRQPQDALFGIVLVSNALIGIVQELRAKRVLDRLAVLNAPRALVIRDGTERDIAVKEVVLDELIALRLGDQIVTDGVVRSSAGLQVDESLLTGESQPIDKRPGDPLLSGSFVVAGTGRIQATAVGVDAYARKLAAEARQFAPAHSELMDGINRILRYVTWAIVPVAALLLFSQIRSHSDTTGAVSSVVAGLVGMVPQGLVLLTSVAFAAAAVTLARREVLVQELPAVEGLARVDVVCFDKTGTLTDGTIAFDRIERLDETVPVEAALGAVADDVDGNATLAAVAGAFPACDGWVRSAAVPFSSARKWSAATFDGHGTWVLGAPELVLQQRDAPELARAVELAGSGQRVLLLAHTSASLAGDRLPPDLRAAALVLLHEQVRPDAAAALAYFAEQGVALKVISGDSPHTVAAVATRLGMPHAEQPCDARELPDEIDALGHRLEEQSVFGRVTPHQKQGMVKALQARGHTVAMTGDGVNDALALKLADVGVAMGSGASATRAVAQLVLLDGRFATLPGVVAEGRRITANMERVSNLFVAKTVWATLLAVAVGIAGWPYPFLPRQLTIIDTLTIGVPAFFLALAPNTRRHVPGFVDRVLRFALPAGLIIATAAFAAFWLARAHDLPLVQQRTGATLVTFIVGLGVLMLMAKPITWRRALLIAIMIASFLVALWIDWVRAFYALTLPREVLGETLVAGAAGVVVLTAWWGLSQRLGGDRTGPP